MTSTSPLPAPLPPQRLLVLPMPNGQQVVVLVAGEVDLACASRLRDGIVDCLVYRPRSLVLDATDLVFCDTHGLDALMDAVAIVERSGVGVTIRPSAQLAWLMTTVQQVSQTTGQPGQDPVGSPLPKPSPSTA